jgi:hypothetical protein
MLSGLWVLTPGKRSRFYLRNFLTGKATCLEALACPAQEASRPTFEAPRSDHRRLIIEWLTL